MPNAPVHVWAVPTPKLNAPLRKEVEREMGDPEGNLVIVERVEHECQRRFSHWEYRWVGTAHVLTSTQDGAVEQLRKRKEVKYIVPFKNGEPPKI